MLEKLKQWAVNQIFSWYFEAYEVPFKKADQKLMEMSDQQRAEYLLMAKAWDENTTFHAEIDECMRQFYSELALKSANVAEIQSYRLTIKFLKDFKKRAALLSASYRPPQMPNALRR